MTETPFSIVGDPFFTNPRLHMDPGDYAPEPDEPTEWDPEPEEEEDECFPLHWSELL